jgi:hypothetical protein
MGIRVNALLGDEEKGEQARGQVMVQTAPSAYLVLSHADFAFRILEGAFNPKATGLTLGEIKESVGG